MTPISATTQFRAVAFLRYRLFINSFRAKSAKADLVARFIGLPFIAFIVLSIGTGAFAAGAAATRHGEFQIIAGIFWAIFLLQIVTSINIAPPGLSFDPESLIRFPLSFTRYLVIRLFLGLLSVSTLAGTLALFSAAIGISVAAPTLAPIAFLSALSLAFSNMLFTRMVFAWVDRWLSTRRARELFTALIFLFSIGVQYLNVTFNGVGRHTSHAQQQAKITGSLRMYHSLQPVLLRLPPGLAASSILDVSQDHLVLATFSNFGILLFSALFLAVFALRMQREYRGENLSDSIANSPLSKASVVSTALTQPFRATQSKDSRDAHSLPTTPHLPPIISACLRKELLYVRRNTTQFYGLVAPLAMVFLFAGRVGSFARTGYTFPAAVTYSLLGVSALAYNCFGLDASGIQFYFLAPVRLRTVILAKNLFGFSLTAIQIALVFVVLCFTSGRPPLLITLTTLCWAVFAALSNVTLGNIRSLTAPKKIDPGKLSRKQASQLSALMSIGLMLTLSAVGYGLLALAQTVHLLWLPIPILLALAFGAFSLYLAGLNRVDRIALRNRQTLIEELCKI